MSFLTSPPSLVFLGENGPAGVYLLRCHVTQPLQLAVGRLHRGAVQTFSPGSYLYVGSALAERGSTSLGRRLLRHATRSTGTGHPLRRRLRAAFPSLSPPEAKRLRWHVDYLLDAPAVVLTGTVALRTGKPLERTVASWLRRRPFITVPVAGAGASDNPGETHLFGVLAYPGWWLDLCRALTYRFGGVL